MAMFARGLSHPCRQIPHTVRHLMENTALGPVAMFACGRPTPFSIPATRFMAPQGAPHRAPVA
eukprot:8138824-Pyramimonas_sp.AAC.1